MRPCIMGDESRLVGSVKLCEHIDDLEKSLRNGLFCVMSLEKSAAAAWILACSSYMDIILKGNVAALVDDNIRPRVCVPEQDDGQS